MHGEVIILTGPPGAGKTTVAKLLASNASAPTVHLTTDLFYRSIRTGFILPFRPEAQQQNEVVIAAIVGTVVTFARGGYDVVVDGIVGPWFLPPFRAAAERDQLALSYVVLRPDLNITLSRANERTGQAQRRRRHHRHPRLRQLPTPVTRGVVPLAKAGGLPVIVWTSCLRSRC